jgi:peroxiredoxin
VPVADGGGAREHPLEVGEVAPDFTLPDPDRVPVTLSEYLDGRIGVVVFFPWAFTSVCTSELCAVRDRLPDLSNDGAATVAVSCDATATLRELRAQQGFDFPLLSDHWPHGEVASAYGVFDGTIGAAVRGTFVVDAGLVVRWRVVNAVPDAREVDDYVRVLASL